MNAADSVPYHDALLAIASVSAIVWTGGLITRQLSGYMDVQFRAGLEYIGYGFFAPLLGLVAQGRTLQITAAIFFMLYLLNACSVFRNAWDTARGTRALPSNLVVTPEKFIRNGWVYFGLSLLGLAAILVIVVYPQNIAIAWASGLMTFIGYQLLLGKVLELQQEIPSWRILLFILGWVTQIDNRLARVIPNPPQPPGPPAAPPSGPPEPTTTPGPPVAPQAPS